MRQLSICIVYGRQLQDQASPDSQLCSVLGVGELPQHCYGIPETSVSLLGTHLGLELLEGALLSLNRANGRDECL